MEKTKTGERIKKKREESGLSLQDIAEKLAVNRSSVMRWENGETNRIKLPVIEKLAKILKTTPKYLMGYEDEDYSKVQFCSTDDACFLPVVKQICGDENLMQPDNVLYYEIAESGYQDGNYFYLLLSGDSMAPQLCEGDRLLIQKQKRLQEGDIGVFLLDGNDGLIRRYQKRKNTELFAFNPYYPVVNFSQEDLSRLQVIGRVIESKRTW
ncbi:MAG: LexA family transcriptional regulator [Ruminococcaceae bacterium]|nr:LexA family transcriptional regulator [Oscillospiraceae bacterium]